MMYMLGGVGEPVGSTGTGLNLQLVRAACMRCPQVLLRSEVSSIIGALFLSHTCCKIAHTRKELHIPAAISLPLTFLPEGVVLGLSNFAQSFKSHKKQDLGASRIGVRQNPSQASTLVCVSRHMFSKRVTTHYILANFTP